MKNIVFIVATSLMFIGCASQRDVPMGKSVAEVTALQTVNPEGHQGDKEGLDATKAEIALRVYRRDVSQPKEVKKAVLDVNP